MRVQKAENVNKALDFIASRGVKLTNIGPEGGVVVVLGVRDICALMPMLQTSSTETLSSSLG